MAFVSHNSSSIIGTSNPVPIFGVSSRLGIKAKLTPKIGNESIDDGNIGALEKYLLNTLGHQQIIKMKLENPLKIADRVITNCETTLKERLDMLDGDRHVLGYIEENMVAFQDDINKEVAFFRRQIHAILDNVQLRGEAFLDENISIFKPKLLFDRKAFELAFERDVAFEIGQPIDDVISDISELILKRAKSHAHAVDAYLGSRPKRYSKEIIGQVRGLDDPGNLFTASRQTLLERLRRDISEIIESHDSSKESRHISLGVRGSLNQMLALQSVSSVAAGGLFFAQFIDISGLIAATGFASSLVLLPYRKQTIK